MRQFSIFEQLICGVDAFVRSVFVPEHRSTFRKNPACDKPDVIMNEKERRHTSGLMRVNHAGEVCAQALYQGQALTAKLETIREQMQHAALEEIDHLGWCEERLRELKSHPSVLNVFWYMGSFAIGAIAGLMGDRWSLGFVAETEHQVAKHLQKHLQNILMNDEKTRAILEKMYDDEILHAQNAEQAGANDLPFVIKKIMHATSLIMTQTSYYI